MGFDRTALTVLASPQATKPSRHDFVGRALWPAREWIRVNYSTGWFGELLGVFGVVFDLLRHRGRLQCVGSRGSSVELGHRPLGG